MKASAAETRLRDFLSYWYELNPDDGFRSPDEDIVAVLHHPIKGQLKLEASDLAAVLNDLFAWHENWRVQTMEPE